MVKKAKKKKPEKKTPKSKPAEKMPANPKFEKTLEQLSESKEATEETTKMDGRGGARPGAGRPKGVSDGFAAVNRLPEKANLTLVPVLCAPFEFWAKTQGLPELSLTKKEATDLALPVTQLLEFYFPGKIPEIAWTWLMMFGTTFNILEPRLTLLADKRKAKSLSSSAGVQGGGGSADSPFSSPSGRPAQPATTYPQDEPKK